VFIAGVIHHQIQDHFHAALLHAQHQFVEVSHGAKLGHHPPVVADVVTIVRIRRIEMRTKPNGVHPQALDVVKLRSNSLQVADAVAIGVLK
jgi:acyl-[acyl carrier protein]--UDP-N-acetylglucosamine O-acyltransferase